MAVACGGERLPSVSLVDKVYEGALRCIFRVSDLGDALERSRKMIQDALADARAELGALQARQVELEALIAQAEAALGETGASVEQPEQPHMTLHEALAHVLRENGSDWMTVRELTDTVNEQGLYRRRDGKPIEVNQVHARTTNYPALFEKDGGSVRLREESLMLTTHPRQSVTLFKDDDERFHDWLDQNPDGYFVNCDREPKSNYLVLHVSSCPHFDRSPKVKWTTAYVKLCSESRADLEEWADETVRGELTLCRDCFR